MIIRENRFTYQNKGLKKLVDLGEYWEQQTGNPIPLGGIVMKRSTDAALQVKVDTSDPQKAPEYGILALSRRSRTMHKTAFSGNERICNAAAYRSVCE